MNDSPTIYHVPLVMQKQGLVDLLCNQFGFKCDIPPKRFMSKWKGLVERVENLRKVYNMKELLESDL